MFFVTDPLQSVLTGNSIHFRQLSA